MCISISNISISTCSSGLTNYTILLSTYDNGEIITHLDIKCVLRSMWVTITDVLSRRVWRYQYPYIEAEQTTAWPKEKVQKDKQRSTKHTHKTKDRVTRTQLKTGNELGCSGRVGSSCSTSGTRCVNLVTNPLISHEWGKDREVFTTSGTYPWSFVTQIFHNDQFSLWNIMQICNLKLKHWYTMNVMWLCRYRIKLKAKKIPHRQNSSKFQ
jgi:hypothetical protein